MGFLLILSRVEKSQQLQDGVMTIEPDKRLALGLGLAAYVSISLVLGLIYIIAS